MVASPQDAKTFAPYFPNLQWIQSTWAGVDALAGHIPESVAITPLRGVFGQAMSEFVLGWILGLERNIIERASSSHGTLRQKQGFEAKPWGYLGRAVSVAPSPKP